MIANSGMTRVHHAFLRSYLIVFLEGIISRFDINQPHYNPTDLMFAT